MESSNLKKQSILRSNTLFLAKPEDDIKALGLSEAARLELRKCNIKTISDLMTLINEKLYKKKEPSNVSGGVNGSSYSVSLQVAVPEIVESFKGSFDLKMVREKLKRRYGNRVSTKKNSIKVALNKLLREGVIEKTDMGDYITCSGSYVDIAKLNRFLDKHIGKKIEFRYKSERLNSDKRWRYESVWAHDEKYLYISKQYKSGRHVFYSKSRIVDYREA